MNTESTPGGQQALSLEARRQLMNESLEERFRHAGDSALTRGLKVLVRRHRENQNCPVPRPRRMSGGTEGATGVTEAQPPAMPVDPQDLRTRLQKMPGLPPLAGELLASFANEEIDLSTLGKRIALDQALLARVLRIANSPFYGLRGQVLSIDEAIMVLGVRAVRTLVLSAALVSGFRDRQCTGFQPERFWHHSVAVAIAARSLAKRIGVNADQVYVAGLLHDLGRYALAVCYPASYQAVLDWQQRRQCMLRQAERDVLGLDHALAGGVLAQLWGLPERFANVMQMHHTPDSEVDAALVHLGDVLAHAIDLGREGDDFVPPPDEAAWACFKPGEALLLEVFEEAERSFDEACRALLN